MSETKPGLTRLVSAIPTLTGVWTVEVEARVDDCPTCGAGISHVGLMVTLIDTTTAVNEHKTRELKSVSPYAHPCLHVLPFWAYTEEMSFSPRA